MITKAIDLSVKDIDLNKREAVIAFATYKTLDLDGDRSNRGMFDKSWREQPNIVRYFLNHDKKQAPGKIEQLWDDADHAYARVKHGTHTIGEDVLKQLDEGIIVAASFGFDPIKYKDIKGKGKDFTEVKHYEVSALTHWGAHTDSGPVAVMKALGSAPSFKLKQLNQQEQDLLNKIITNGIDNLQAAIAVAAELDTESDLYTAIMWMISRQADMVGDVRSRLSWGMKEATESQIKKMQKFIRNTTASDECIQQVQKSLNILLNKDSDTATTTDNSMVKCRKCNTHSVAQTNDDGSIKCAECGHLIKEGRQPDASRNKEDELRLKRLVQKRESVVNATY